MKPVKGLLPFAMWLLRLSILLFAFAYFFPVVKPLTFNGLYYFISLAFLVFGILLFIGGFLSKPAMTVFSGLILFILSGYMLFDLYEGFSIEMFKTFSPFLLVAASGMMFAAIGNKT